MYVFFNGYDYANPSYTYEWCVVFIPTEVNIYMKSINNDTQCLFGLGRGDDTFYTVFPENNTIPSLTYTSYTIYLTDIQTVYTGDAVYARGNVITAGNVITTGNVGIGITTPIAQLHTVGNAIITGNVDITGTVGIGAPILDDAALTIAMYGNDYGILFDNSISNRKITLYNTQPNEHQYYGFGVNGSTLRYQVDSTNSSHIFYAGTSDSASSELMRITGSGSVGIGTSSPATALVVNGTIRNINGPAPNSGTSLVITGNGDIAPQSSDARFKTNIEDLPSVINAMMNMRAVSYTWKDETQKWYGLLAQQVSEVFPDAAWHNTQDDTYGVHYTPTVVTLLLKAIQEQQQMIKGLQTTIQEQNQRISALENLYS